MASGTGKTWLRLSSHPSPSGADLVQERAYSKPGTFQPSTKAPCCHVTHGLYFLFPAYHRSGSPAGTGVFPAIFRLKTTCPGEPGVVQNASANFSDGLENFRLCVDGCLRLIGIIHSTEGVAWFWSVLLGLWIAVWYGGRTRTRLSLTFEVWVLQRFGFRYDMVKGVCFIRFHVSLCHLGCV